MSYSEYLELIHQYRKVAGLPFKEVPEEMIELGKRIRELRKQINLMTLRGEKQENIAPLHGELAQLESRMRKFLAELKKS